MSTLLTLLVLGVLIGAVASVIAYVLIHAAPRLSQRARRIAAPMAAALLVMIPALSNAIPAGAGAVAQVLLFGGALALVFGYPMVRLFEPKPREKD
ncbi:hypothetical protein [Paraurantiacibacter namhicola]|uniref:Uncharacterized protein n=1 Tax=Paraurantiacibacter namhicola TaxID=645517 RepID=A0A1C7D8F5_9SPHN|nr:hypothetical protein [Paraurantiacibacter namhicola]ANU07760.1 hypothetical protein A6F65_01456 [Paraurantiacibacter namhicola]